MDVTFFQHGFRVRGLQPRPQPRPRAVRRGRKAQIVSTMDPASAAWRKAISWSTQAWLKDAGADWLGVTGAVGCDLIFFRGVKSKAKHGQFMTGRPDGDNLAKAVLDAAETAQLFAVGDQQVTDLRVRKVYSAHDAAGVQVRFIRLDDLFHEDASG